MTDYCAFVPVVNRPDLLVDTVAAANFLYDDFTIIDNSGIGMATGATMPWSPQVKVFTPPVPLSFTQTMNWVLKQALSRDKPICVFMHSDAVIPEGACEKLLEYARNIHNEHPRWGIIYTNYDVLCAYNPRVFEDIGGFDTNFAWYFSDNDYFRRMELAGWQRINSGIEVGHAGSQTINSDSYLRHVNGVTFPLYGEYYRAKWGGTPNEETFTHPFGVLPKEWKLGKVS